MINEVSNPPDKIIGKESIVKKPIEKRKMVVLSEQKRKVLNERMIKRMNECVKNDLSFKNKKIKIQNLNQDIQDLFEKAFRAPEAGEMYKQYLMDLESKPTYNLVSYDREMVSLDICKGIFALEFLDKIIDSKKFDVPFLIKNLNENLLENHFSGYNLALIFGKISRMDSYGLLPKEEAKEVLELRDRFEKIENEFTYNVNHLENDDLAQDLFINYYNSLEEIGTLLKQALEKLSGY